MPRAHTLIHLSGSKPRCRVCGGIEGVNMPPNCPGRIMTEAELDGIEDGTLKEIDGRFFRNIEAK